MSDQQTTGFHRIKNPRLTVALLLVILIAVVTVLGIDIDARASASIRIGVLAHKGTDICREMWQPTIVYLGKALPGRQFVLVPLRFEEIEPAVKNKSIDFLICNSAIYVDLEVRYGVSRTMTLRNLVGTQIVSEFGGVIFCRADRSDLNGLRDVRGQRFAAARETSFGGWYMALREFRSAGIDPERDCARLIFLGNHPAVVRAVLSGEVDIGTVRTDTIERMAANGEIRMDEIRVITADVAPGSRSTFPYLLSTRLYPEWPFAKLSDTTDELSREVTVALLTMPADSPAALAAQSGGWGVCLDYTSVHDCLRELRLPPYEHYGQMSWPDMWRQYWPWLVAITALIVALLGALVLLRGRQLAVMMVSGRNRLLLASAGEGICGIDINGITTFVNPAANIILGYTTGELLGKNLHALTHHTKPDGLPYPSHECPIFMACIDGTVHQGSDEFFYRKDGSAIPISYSSRPIVNMGKISGAVICFQDITEQKRADEALKSSLSLLSAALESTADGLLIVNSEGKVTKYNQKFAEMWKMPEDVLSSHDDDVLINRVLKQIADPGHFLSKVREMYSMPEALSFDQIEFKDGRIFERYSQPQKIGNLVVGRVWSFRDVTARKQAVDALRKSEASLREAYDIARLARWELDLASNHFVWSDGVFELLGVNRENFATTYETFLDIVHPDDRAQIDLTYRMCIEEKKPKEIEHRLLINNGRIKWVSAMGRTECDEAGNPVRFIGTIQDITERKLAEEDQAKIKSQLQQAQKMEAIGSLAGGIAHDLNNILFPISGLSEMLLEDIPPGSPAHESIEQIHKSSQRGSELVKQILAFSRQSNPRKLPIRIQPILKEVLKLARATISKTIEITSHIETDCDLISADPTQVYQIVMNLITNAHHAVDENGGTIHIALREADIRSSGEKNESPFNMMQSGKYACITVSDTGKGIELRLIDKIFTPYFTTKEQGKGTGLGLSVVHGIVKEHGGDIQVYSEVGKGTAFHVYLPLLEDARDSKTAGVTRMYPTGCERILLVDDEEPIVSMEQMMLEKLGYRVTSRTSSPDALAAFKANPNNYDLVISDRGMPNMTGEQLARELISIKPEIPIIICTGFSDENDEERAKTMGIKGYLMKPVSLDDLAVTVRKVLDDFANSLLVHESVHAAAITPVQRPLKDQDNE